MLLVFTILDTICLFYFKLTMGSRNKKGTCSSGEPSTWHI
uniref:Uncharacterized protein n=1 Tax=Arundo donax TaxID=35708 RepID=A0A0A9AP66_ARUDO